MRRLRVASARPRAPAALTAALLYTVVILAAGCLKREIEPFRPLRPWLGSTSDGNADGSPREEFPERSFFADRNETPPRTLLRTAEIFRQIGSLPGPEPEWRLPRLYLEIDSIRTAYDRLELAPPSLLPWGQDALARTDPAVRRRAAQLQIRWGLALMRTGEVNQRVWGAERLQEAMRFVPEDPLPVIVFSAYQQLAGFRSNEIDLLERWNEMHGPDDLVELQLLRRRERLWAVLRDRGELDQAFAWADRLATRRGGWEQAPTWLHFERARLYLQADSLVQAKVAAQAAVRDSAEAALDPLTAAQAQLMLGVIDVRRFEFASAEQRLALGLELARREPTLTGLVSWLQVPWDLLSEEERFEMSRQGDRRAWIERLWSRNDPIEATPRLSESRLLYESRVAEAWFLLNDVDPVLPGPLSEPGQVFLRFGRPDEWTSVAPDAFDAARFGSAFSVGRLWDFHYDLPGALPGGSLRLHFRDHGTEARFVATDSLHSSRYPRALVTPRPGERSYRYEEMIYRLRQPDGRTRLLLCYDTFLPDYAVRFPLQGLRFSGTARIRTAMYLPRGRDQYPSRQMETILDRESVREQHWSFRRRSGSTVIPDLESGLARFASQFELRDDRSGIVGFQFDNGTDRRIERFDERTLQASDLILLAPLGEAPPDPEDREPRAGWKIHGPDLFRDGLEPRAARLFLAGEPMAYYLEVYGLTVQRGLTDARMSTTLEHLREDGTEDYSVTTEGLSQSLVRFGIRQWNVARTVGLTHLAPGFYRLRIDVEDRPTGTSLHRDVLFRVTTPDELAEVYGWSRIPPP